MRRDAREAVYKYLYAELYNQEENNIGDEIFGEAELNDTDKHFSAELLSVIQAHSNEIEAEISKLSEGYSYDRIYSTVKCALIIAFAEMKYIDDIPHIVSIDEALNLIRKFSDTDGMNFANGILASYKKELESTNENN